ncbi:MAG: hypothetical protein IJC18_02215, partial [Clostridia bacterium]|nr:hypothetical protein [Clostridia bacterium]
MAEAQNNGKGARSKSKKPNSPRYSERYGANRPNPYTGYLPPGAAPAGQIYHPESINLSKRSQLIAESASDLVEANAMAPAEKPEDTSAPVREETAAEAKDTQGQKTTPRKRTRTSSAPKRVEDDEYLTSIREAAAAAVIAEQEAQAAKAAQEKEASGIPSDAVLGGTAQIRLSADGKPMVAVPIIDDKGNSQIMWMPVAIPQPSDDADKAEGAGMAAVAAALGAAAVAASVYDDDASQPQEGSQGESDAADTAEQEVKSEATTQVNTQFDEIEELGETEDITATLPVVQYDDDSGAVETASDNESDEAYAEDDESDEAYAEDNDSDEAYAEDDESDEAYAEDNDSDEAY